MVSITTSSAVAMANDDWSVGDGSLEDCGVFAGMCIMLVFLYFWLR